MKKGSVDFINDERREGGTEGEREGGREGGTTATITGTASVVGCAVRT